MTDTAVQTRSVARPRSLPWLYLVGVVAAVVILGPALGPGYLLYRDAVSTPQSFVTDATLGIGDVAPRAVPQDWFVALASSVVDGGTVVCVLLFGALVAAAVGYGRLALRLVPAASRSGAVAAAVVGVWNPFVAERLLQGHWSLLTGFAALGWLVVAVLDLADRPRSTARWLQTGGLLAAAGLTPTGSVLAVIVVIVTAVATRPRLLPGYLVLWCCSALPWLVATAVGGAGVDSDGALGVRAFGLRSEPFLGSVGTALGLGGIWNADAVPTSRTIWWAAVATVCLLVVIVAGSVMLWRGRAGLPALDRSVVGALGGLAAVVVIVVAVTAVGPGRDAFGWVVGAVPGGGLLRDSQKFLALAVPFVAVACAAMVSGLRRYVPAGFALTAVGLLVVAPLPDLAWGVGGRVMPVTYPADWSAVAAIVGPDDGAVALWPPGTVRHYPYVDGASLDPASRMLRAPVVESGELRVDARVIDPRSSAAGEVESALQSGDVDRLRSLRVGWVLVEHNVSGDPLPPAVDLMTPTFSGDALTLFRIEGAQSPSASTAARVAAWSAHLMWAAMLIGGIVAVAYSTVSGIRAQRRGR